MKRYRREIGPVRFYMCGEYGEKLGRPHYHYLVFGHDFKDKSYFKKSLAGTRLYRSAQLERLWPWGYSYIGEVDLSTCAYVASYCMKKITGEKAEEHYRRTDEAGNDFYLMREFAQMSRNPGIAYEWWKRYSNDVTVNDTVYTGPNKSKPPRYYDQLLERFDPRLFESIKDARKENARLKAGDNTPARLHDKEIVQTARLQLKKRQLEH